MECVDVESLKKKLSCQYRAGCRWLAYDILRGSGWMKRIYCFAGYGGASAWCKARSGREGIFRIRILSDVLSAMNGRRLAEPTVADRHLLRDLLEARPMSGYKEAIPLDAGLLQQKYFPVLWNRWEDPLRVVYPYQLLCLTGAVGEPARIRVKGSFEYFKAAVASFMAVARQTPASGGEWLLVGIMHGAAKLRDGEVLPDNGVVVFYRSGPGNAECSKMNIEQVHDPAEPVLIRTPFFASYDRQHRVIRFYDGMLKVVQPGRYLDIMDLGWFDFDCGAIFDECV
jgi:hypothetical protein